MRASGEVTSAPTEIGERLRPEWPNDLEPGTWISGRYMIVRCIGSGGVGAVYEAEQQSLGRKVAIKLLHPDQLRRARGKERFEREARTAASINHPHVVAVYDFDTHEGVPYLVMELLRGQTVEQLLETGGRLPLRRGLLLLLGASRGLEALHAGGLVHRDLKPANLFVSQGEGAEHCKILDFGITKQREDQNLTVSTELVGTPAYMAPERIERPAEADQRADIFALAVTAYEMFTGGNLHDGTPHEILLRIMAGTLPPLSAFTAVMPEVLAQLLYRCLSKRPEDRPQTAAQFSAELDRILRALPTSSDEEFAANGSLSAAGSKKDAGKRPRALRLALLGGALLVSLAGFLFLIPGGHREASPTTATGSAAASGGLSAGNPRSTSSGVAWEGASSEALEGTASPVELALKPQAEVRPSARPLAAHREPGLDALAAEAAAGRRKNGREGTSVPRSRPAQVRGSSDPLAQRLSPSVSAGSRLPVEPPRFVARSGPPQFLPRSHDEPGESRPTSAKERQPLAPGQLFRPRPSKEE